MTDVSQTIPVRSGWGRVYTHVMFDGASESTPVLIDTGSSELAVCPGADMGRAEATGDYATCRYGNTGAYGWVGEWYEGHAQFGFEDQWFPADGAPILAALITEEVPADLLCGRDLKGILGVDFGGNQLFDQPQEFTEGPLGYLGSTQRESFATTMLDADDDYTMAFVGVQREDEDSGQAVIAFGSTAHALLADRKLVGSTPIIAKVASWYTLKTPMTVQIRGADWNTDVITYQVENQDDNPIIDSGTPTLVLPQGVASAAEDAGHQLDALPEDATITITLPGVKPGKSVVLELPVSTVGGAVEGGDHPIIGFPVFWVYDVKFETQAEVLSFYGRG